MPEHKPTEQHVALLAAQPHKIEEAVRVYLVADFTTGRWVPDSATLDGYELFSDYEDGPLREACECGDENGHAPDCDAFRKRAADEFGLPDAHDLLLLLAEAYGYDLKPRT
jgi:hypothetical protein